MIPSEEIRKIWEEIKELKRNEPPRDRFAENRLSHLSKKYENIEILFGHESSLNKAIIFYLDMNK